MDGVGGHTRSLVVSRRLPAQAVKPPALTEDQGRAHAQQATQEGHPWLWAASAALATLLLAMSGTPRETKTICPSVSICSSEFN